MTENGYDKKGNHWQQVDQQETSGPVPAAGSSSSSSSAVPHEPPQPQPAQPLQDPPVAVLRSKAAPVQPPSASAVGFAPADIGFDPMLLEPFVVEMVKWHLLGGVGAMPEPSPEWPLAVVNYAHQVVTHIMLAQGIPDAEL